MLQPQQSKKSIQKTIDYEQLSNFIQSNMLLMPSHTSAKEMALLLSQKYIKTTSLPQISKLKQSMTAKQSIIDHSGANTIPGNNHIVTEELNDHHGQSNKSAKEDPLNLLRANRQNQKVNTSPTKEQRLMIIGTPVKNSIRQKPKSIPPSVRLPEVQSVLRYHLGQGNNHEFIKRVMDTRPNWHQTQSTTRANFRWAQSNHSYRYFKMNWHQSHRELLNHFEFHQEITNKKNLLINLEAACEITKQQIFDFIPVTFIFDFQDNNIESQIFRFLNFFNRYAPLDKQINDIEFQSKMLEIKKKLRIPPGKDRKILEYVPRQTLVGQDYLWLLKPTGLNRGRGIHVFNNIDSLVNLLIDYQYGYQEKINIEYKDEQGQTQVKQQTYLLRTPAFVIQKYIEKPLLIRNRKFDIRVWAMIDQDLKFYFFKEGYVRTASELYSTTDTENLYIHLTNNAIQKFSDKYGELDSGNQMSFEQVQQYFKGQVDFKNLIVPEMKSISYFAMNSIQNKINKNNRKFCFEIFGLDYMLDDEFNLYLIEVNTNPCIEESSPLLQMLLPRMIDDAYTLTLDQLFPRPKASESNFQVTNYSDEENMWDLIGELHELP